MTAPERVGELSDLCDRFRRDVFAKAGKADPREEARDE